LAVHIRVDPDPEARKARVARIDDPVTIGIERREILESIAAFGAVEPLCGLSTRKASKLRIHVAVIVGV
jgi:hypothetical protein